MIMLLAVVLQLTGIIVQGVVCLLLLKFAKSFGAYAEDYRAMTTQLLTTSESNMAVQAGQLKIIEILQRVETKQSVKGAA